MEKAFSPENALGQVFESVRAALTRDMCFPSFFFSLDPLNWAIRFQGIEAQGDSEAGRFISAHIERYLERSEAAQSVDDVRAIVRAICSDSEWPPKRIYAGAIHILSRLTIPLGWQGSDVASTEINKVWSRPDVASSVSLKGFQIALSHALRNRDEFSAEATVFGSSRAQLVRHGDIMEIRHYMTIPRLFDAHSIEVFIAEYFFATGGAGDADPAAMSLSFLPLAALGQWRASACWITLTDSMIGSRSHIVTSSLKAALQEVCSFSLVNTFCALLGSAIVEKMRRHSPAAWILRAFASLWWVEEAAFFREGTRVMSASRDQSGSLSEVPRNRLLPSNPTERPGIIRVCRGDSSLSEIHLNLDFPQLPASNVRTLLGFDQVVMSLRLFDPDLLSPRMEETLAARILGVLEMQWAQASLVEAQRRVERVAAIEAVGHTMKNTVKALGWRHALRKLNELPPQADPAVRDALAEAARSLSLFTFVEGAGELLRIASTCDREDYRKLRSWTSPEALEAWNTAAPDLFYRYRNFIVGFLHTVFYGTLARNGFVLSVRDGVGVRRSLVDTSVRPENAIEDQVRLFGPLFPLLANRDTDSHVTLLSTLIEPAYNAIKWIHGHPEYGLIHVGICNSLPRSIDVSITNRIAEWERGIPQGLRMTDHLMRTSSLGSLSLRPQGNFSKDQNLFSVAISLTPQRLCRHILDAARMEAE